MASSIRAFAMTDHSLESDRTLASQAVVAGPAAVGADGLVYESGLEVETRSQWTYARRRFVRHRLAVASLVVLILVLGAGAFAPVVAPHPYDGIDLENAGVGPTFDNWHLFGTDLLGRDYFSRVIYGIQTSEKVAFIVAFLAVVLGTAVGAVSGYYSGWVDNGLMRFTDLMLTLPGLAVLLTAAAFLGHGSPYRVAVILGFLL
jgi:ABC-type dipeptide/oligopeptide/nickel transport system permease subunit